MADEEVERTRKNLKETSFLNDTPSSSAESFVVLDYSSDDEIFSNNGVEDDTEVDNTRVNKSEEEAEERNQEE